MTMLSCQNLNHLQSTLAMCFANSNEAVMLLDKSFHIIFISGAVAKIDEQIKDKLLNNSFLNLLSELDKVKVLELLNTLNEKNNSSSTVNLNLIYPNGYQFWVNLTLSINFEVDDSIIVVNINPVDQQTIIQNSLFLNRNSSLLESVVANISEGVMIIELDLNLAQQSKIIYVNKAFPLLTGYHLNELQGNSPKFLQASLTDESYVLQLKKSIFEGSAFDSTLPCRKKNGELYWAEASFSPLKNENEIHTNWIITFRDVTARKELEDVLRKASTLAGIGSWAYEPKTRKIFWSNMTKHIYEVGSDFNPDVENTAKFFKHSKQNQIILDQISEGITAGKAFDLEVEILTAKKNKKWIRIIGEPEIRNKDCQKISGSFQDIDQRKKAQLLAEKSMQEKNEIFESIADGFFAVDKKWKITYWNSRAAEEVNRSKGELLNQNLWDVFSEAVGSYSYKKYHEALKFKKPVQFESYAKDSSQWYDISAYPSANGLSVYFRNITARKKDKELLLDTEQRYHDLFQLSPLPKWVFDMETLRFLDVNQAAIAHYGYSYDEFMEMTILDIRNESEHEVLHQLLQEQTPKQSFIHQGVFNHQKKNGDFLRVSIQSAFFIYKGRDAKIIIAHDVTEQEQYIKAIELQNQKLKEVSWINSHILRAPLTKILGLLEVAKIVDEHQERKVILDYMQTAANELDRALLEITNRSKTTSSNN